jgi:hypothetical protein|nr:MAG TPA: hypothetical protein [Caudoviricetes sp.]
MELYNPEIELLGIEIDFIGVYSELDKLLKTVLGPVIKNFELEDTDNKYICKIETTDGELLIYDLDKEGTNLFEVNILHIIAFNYFKEKRMVDNSALCRLIQKQCKELFGDKHSEMVYRIEHLTDKVVLYLAVSSLNAYPKEKIKSNIQNDTQSSPNYTPIANLVGLGPSAKGLISALSCVNWKIEEERITYGTVDGSNFYVQFDPVFGNLGFVIIPNSIEERNALSELAELPLFYPKNSYSYLFDKENPIIGAINNIPVIETKDRTIFIDGACVVESIEDSLFAKSKLICGLVETIFRIPRIDLVNLISIAKHNAKQYTVNSSKFSLENLNH